MKPFIDKILAFTISKKLSVFIIATFLILSDKLPSDDWVRIAIMYIGTQGVIDIFIQLFNVKRNG